MHHHGDEGIPSVLLNLTSIPIQWNTALASFEVFLAFHEMFFCHCFSFSFYKMATRQRNIFNLLLETIYMVGVLSGCHLPAAGVMF